jgi:hypothetical protein
MPAPRLKEGVDSKYMTIEVWDQGEVSFDRLIGADYHSKREAGLRVSIDR